MEREEFYKQLVHRYVNDYATEEELQAFFQLVGTGEIEEVLKRYMDTETGNVKQNNLIKKNRFLYFKLIAVAASFVIVLASIGFLYFNHDKKVKVRNIYTKNTIVPGGNKAVLTLSNGKKIILTNTHNGLITNQRDILINKISDGHITYAKKQSPNENAGVQTDLNILTTPSGGTYKLTLPDGTNVWLNALSSIRFPVVFTGKERTVEVTGEAYFEVVKNTAMPFIVKTARAEIRVLGTHFNVMAYTDEPVFKTTLLKGSVRIKSNNESSTLRPFEQALIVNDGKLRKVEDKDAEDEIAWKNGDFQFKDAPLNGVMRQVGRWYNVKIIYNEDQNDKLRFTGKISRKVSIAGLIEIFKFQGIDLSIKGKSIIINNLNPSL